MRYVDEVLSVQTNFLNKPQRIVSSFDKKNSSVITGDIFDLSQSLPKEFFKLIITSPPYNIGKDYEKKQNLESYMAWQSEIVAKLLPLLRLDGSLCWQVGNFVQKSEIFPLDIFFYPIFKKLGLKLRNRIIWHFNHGLHASKRLSGRYETLLWFTKSDNYTFNLDSIRVPSKYPGKLHFKGAKKGLPSGNPKGKNPSDYWELLQKEFDLGVIDIPNVKSNHPEKTIHPCQFPVELVERCVMAFTNENDWVLDPFGGVGSTLVASIKLGRKCVSVDKQKAYCDLAKERAKKFFRGELKLRPLGKPIHVPSGKEKVSQLPSVW